jgi:hypothetical protein
MPDPGIRGAIPLFPIGCPRSGTTLLARLLNAHPAVLVTNETAVFLQLHENIVKSREGSPAGLPYGKEYNAVWADHLAGRATALIEAFYERVRAMERKSQLRYWGDKHPHHSHCLPFIAELYPQARYVYLVRDPRDVACSIGRMASADHAEVLRSWRDMADQYEAFVQGLGPDRVLTLRYEDLVEDDQGTARRVFDWLALDYAPEVEAFLLGHRDIDVHTIGSAEPRQADFRVESIGRWRRELSASDIELAADVAGAFMTKHGYAIDVA